MADIDFWFIMSDSNENNENKYGDSMNSMTDTSENRLMLFINRN